MKKPQPAKYPYVMPVPAIFGLGPHFAKGVACKVHHRDLPASADFTALGLALCGHYNYQNYMKEEKAEDLEQRMHRLSAPAREAAEFVLRDMEELRARFNYKALLRVGGGYSANGVPGRFHADGVDAICAAYAGAGTEYLRQGDSLFARHVQVKTPDKRTHAAAIYDRREGAEILSFRPGDIWIQKGGTDPAGNLFVHRGPAADPRPDAPPRVLIVALPGTP